MQAVVIATDDVGAVEAELELSKLGKTAFEKRRKWMTAAFVAVMVVVVPLTSSHWGATSLAGELFFIAGITLATIGCLGRLWSGLFISGYKSRELIVCGPYSLCRNPLYFFSAVGLVGVGLMTCTLSVPIVFCSAFAIYYPLIIASEERRLHLRHGRQFEDYCESTPSFWPRFRAYHEPESYVIRTRAIRRNFVDGAWFVILAVIVRIAAEQHGVGGWPSMLTAW